MNLLPKLFRLRDLLQGMVFTGELTYTEASMILEVDGEISRLQREILRHG